MSCSAAATKVGSLGNIGAQEVAKLMVTEGLTECVGLEAERRGSARSESSSDKMGRRETLRQQRGLRAPGLDGTARPPGDRAPAGRGQPLQ